MIGKERASAFFGTPLIAYLQKMNIDTVIVCGESTSGCFRASAVDAYSYGFHVVMAEEACFDRSLLSHKGRSEKDFPKKVKWRSTFFEIAA